LLLDAAVIVRYSKRDPDGTLVGAILLNDLNICLDQVKEGMARYDDPSAQSRSTQELYAGAEATARKYRVGLWSGISLHTDSSSPAPVVVSEATSDSTVDVKGYFRTDGTYVAGYQRTTPAENSNPYTGQVRTKKQSRWISALKVIGVGAALGAMMYLDAKYSSPTARCNDGTYSYSLHRQGTCSHHRGVAYWLR